MSFDLGERVAILETSIKYLTEQLEDTHPPSACAMFVAVGFSGVNKTRRAMYDECKSKGYELISYVNSKAIHWGKVELGDNCFVFEANVIQPFVRIGSNVIIWSGNHIGHHSRIRDNVFISSHVVVSGSVDVGENSFLGVNSTLVNDITIGRDTWLGPQVTVTRDVAPGSVYRPPRSELRNASAYELFGVDG